MFVFVLVSPLSVYHLQSIKTGNILHFLWTSMIFRTKKGERVIDYPRSAKRMEPVVIEIEECGSDMDQKIKKKK